LLATRPAGVGPGSRLSSYCPRSSRAFLGGVAGDRNPVNANGPSIALGPSLLEPTVGLEPTTYGLRIRVGVLSGARTSVRERPRSPCLRHSRRRAPCEVSADIRARPPALASQLASGRAGPSRMRRGVMQVFERHRAARGRQSVLDAREQRIARARRPGGRDPVRVASGIPIAFHDLDQPRLSKLQQAIAMQVLARLAGDKVPGLAGVGEHVLHPPAIVTPAQTQPPRAAALRNGTAG